MQKKGSYILWLPSWYPNKLEPFNGDFIQRHAQAVSLMRKVHVLFVMRDKTESITKDVFEESFEHENHTEHLIYYAVAEGPAFFQKALSQLRYQQLFKKAIRQHIRKYGTPELVHVHVTFKAGLLALWLKKKYALPYVVTEHWSGFLPEAEPNFKTMPIYIRAAYKKIWKEAASVSAVSHYLHEHLKKLVSGKDMRVIPNVVDTTIFKPRQMRDAAAPTFIHVSGLGYQKNPEAILKAFAYVNKKAIPFLLHMVGPPCPRLQQLARDLNIEDRVFFDPEVPQRQLAEQMQQSHALLLYSRYETFGCVVAEANACGLPVIVSDIPVLHEIVTEGLNGLFAPVEDSTLLGERMIWFIQNSNRFDRATIAQQAHEAYNYRTVASQFNDWYNWVLRP